MLWGKNNRRSLTGSMIGVSGPTCLEGAKGGRGLRETEGMNGGRGWLTEMTG